MDDGVQHFGVSRKIKLFVNVQVTQIRMNIRRFSGFPFSADSAERKKKVDKLTKAKYG